LAYRLSELAELVDGSVTGDGQRTVVGVRPLESAGPNDLSFLSNPRYKDDARKSAAGALLVSEPIAGFDRDFLVVENPYLALAKLLDVLYSASEMVPGIDPTAVVAEDADIDPTVSIGPFSVIGPFCKVGSRVQIAPHVVIGADCQIGADSVLNPRVVLYDRTEVGERCILHAGVVLGSDGFGFAQTGGKHRKLKHIGRVVVEDDVEIGANTTIDRALLDETRIGAGTKIDNLVQVAHNVRLGRGCLLVAQSGISGSTRLGDGVVLAGQSGISGHKVLGDGVQVAAKSAVFKSVEAGKTVAGIPAIDAGAWRRQQAIASKLDGLRKRLIALEKQLHVDQGREGDRD
jgi:UDP-3-O-[3-hydroxymyristoyl] glucosamine N-acyltransferase